MHTHILLYVQLDDDHPDAVLETSNRRDTQMPGGQTLDQLGETYKITSYDMTGFEKQFQVN